VFEIMANVYNNMVVEGVFVGIMRNLILSVIFTRWY